MPAYWLGAFFNPHGLVSTLKQEAIRNHIEKSGNVDSIVFHTEVTQREKDHVSDTCCLVSTLKQVFSFRTAP